MLIETPLVALIALALQAAPEPAVEPETQAVETEAAETEAVPTGETAEASEGTEGTEGPPVDEQAQKERDDEIICRREAVIGSKFKKRICATRKEWQTLAERSRDTTQELQNRGVGFEPVN